jgi:hypothetical protein
MPASLCVTLRNRKMPPHHGFRVKHVNALRRRWQEIRNTFRALIAYVPWILVKPKLFWLVILPPFAVFYLATYVGSEPAFRLLGLGLQIAGTLIVIFNIRDTRKQFNRPGFVELAKEWFRSRPRLLSRSVTVNLKGAAAVASRAVARVEVWRGVPAGATLEVRVGALEENQDNLNKKINEFRRETEQALRGHGDELKQEKQARDEGDQSLQAKLASAQTEGLYISTMGICWLLAGMIMSGASVELAQLPTLAQESVFKATHPSQVNPLNHNLEAPLVVLIPASWVNHIGSFQLASNSFVNLSQYVADLPDAAEGRENRTSRPACSRCRKKTRQHGARQACHRC